MSFQFQNPSTQEKPLPPTKARHILRESHKTPFDVDKINFGKKKKNEFNPNNIEDIEDHLREILCQRGIRGIMSLKRTFMLIDENNNHMINKENFKRVLLLLYRIELSEIEIENLFNHFDKEKKNEIDYKIFLNEIMGELNERKKLIEKIFEKLDVKKENFITVKTIRENFNAKENFLVRKGKKKEQEILAEFMDLIEYHFNLLNDKDDENIDINDIKVDLEEFCNFYKNVSLTVENDKLFEIKIAGEWGLKIDGKYPYQKNWNEEDEDVQN
jgi:Ca2+-binding EF-hand superfamily protein